MINSNNKSGFSLLETIIAMTIIALMAVPLIIMQGTLLRRVVRDSRREDRIFLMRNFLYKVHRDMPPDTTNDRDKVGDVQLSYQRMSPKESSSLHAMKGIHIEQVTATWYELGKKTQDVMVTLKYIEPETPKAQT